MVSPACGISTPAASREPRQRGHVAGLALIGRHAERGVALEMLDRAIALAPGEIDVGGGHVVLEVDEAVLGIGQVGGRRRDGVDLARRRSDAGDRLGARAGDEGLKIAPPVELAARLTVQMDGRGEAARHRQQIGSEPALLAPYPRVDGGKVMPPAARRERHRLGEDRKARCVGTVLRASRMATTSPPAAAIASAVA